MFMVCMCLAQDANVNVQAPDSAHRLYKSGLSPIVLAARRGHGRLVALLIANGARTCSHSGAGHRGLQSLHAVTCVVCVRARARVCLCVRVCARAALYRCEHCTHWLQRWPSAFARVASI